MRAKMGNATRFLASVTIGISAAATVILQPQLSAEELWLAQVRILGSVWSDGGCPNETPSSPAASELPKVLEGKCGGMLVDGQAAAWVVGECGTGNGSHMNIGSITYDLGGTGCHVDIINGDQGAETLLFTEPKHHGTVKITATVTGSCDCTNHTMITYRAVGQFDVDVPDDDDPPPPGPPGGPPGGSGPPGCGGTCGRGGGNGSGPAAAGVGSPGNSSVDFRLALGLDNYHKSAGYVSLEAGLPSAGLSQPGLLEVPFVGPSTQVIPASSTDPTIRQVKSLQMLVNVNTVSSSEYWLQCYYDKDVVHPIGGNGFYSVNTGAQPFTTWKIKNPNTSSYNVLQITEVRGTSTRTFQYTYTASSLQWELLRPDGTKLVTWTVRDSTDGNITNYFRELKSAGGNVVWQNQKTWQFRPTLGDRVLTQEIEGSGTTTRTTTYTYYPSTAAAGSANQLQRIDYPDGNWVYYDYDSLGRKSREYSAWLNNIPPTSGEPSPPSTLCKVTDYAYTLSSDDGTTDPGDASNPWSLRKTVVSFPCFTGGQWTMQEVSRTYHTSDYDLGTEETQQCITPGKPWDDASNLKTTTLLSVASDYSFGLPTSITGPNGLTTTYGYNDGLASETDPDGTYIETSFDDLAQITEYMKRFNGITIQDDVYNRGTAPNYIDPLRMGYDLTDLAGNTTQYRYTCCGLDYILDPDGALTQYGYDSLRRPTSLTRYFGGTSGITTANTLNAAGQVLATSRTGTDLSSITLSQTTYDTILRPNSTINGLGGTTIITNIIINNRLCVTNTYPDGGIRIETFYRDGQPEMIFGSAVVGAVHYTYGVEQDGTGSGAPYRQFTLETKMDGSGNDTSEWVKTYVDAAGRAYKTIYAPQNQQSPPYSQTFFNSFGQLSSEQDPDRVVTLYNYNATSGLLEYTATDVNGNGTIDMSNANDVDRVTRVVKSSIVAANGKPDLIEKDTYVWNDGATAGTLVSSSAAWTGGLHTWNTTYGPGGTPVVTEITNVYSTGGNRYTTNIAPDGSFSVTAYSYGRASWTGRFDSSGTQVQRTSFAYDAHGRQATVTDARNGTTSYTFNSADQVLTATTPAPGTGQGPQTTTTDYDTSLRAWRVTQPDNSCVTNEFYPTGLVKRNYGSRTYAIGYGYDTQGRMTKMTNWTSFNAVSGSVGERVTTWNYNQYRGWLDNKRYPDGLGPDYTYTPGGRLRSRTWARSGTDNQRIVTSYSYGFDTSGTAHGDLVSTTYSANDPAATPSVTTGYDRRGRPTTITRGGTAITTLTYNDPSELLTESYSGSGTTLAGLSVTNGYDQFLRRTNVVLLNSSSPVVQQTNSYDTASRLSLVGDGGPNTATYSYLANSPLVSQITFKQSGATRMTTTKNYDFLNRLLSISSSPSSSSAAPVVYSYLYNDANERIRVTLADGSFWVYLYDSLGQVVSGKRYWQDGTPVAGQQFEYGFDGIGNRSSTKAGGDASGANLRSANYSANNLNQYTSRDVPAAVDITGVALATSSVTVNSQSPYRHVEYFRYELGVNNASAPVWQSVSVSASGQGNAQSGNIYVPKTPEQFGYDYDGNLTSDGRWSYTWDAENRLISMQAISAVPSSAKLKLDFAYDYKGRRIQKTVSTWNGSSYGSPVITKFVYDGWNLIASLDSQLSTVNSFLWGSDLSGSLQGAGGIGGLLEINDSVNGGYFPAFDGNGNVTGLVKAADGTVCARYEYSPFGEVIRATDPMAKANPLRFSTKYQDDETDSIYYSYRYLKNGRWLSRDPAGEDSGELNLYGFVSNEPLDNFDELGLWRSSEIDRFVRGLDEVLRKIRCCCEQKFPLTLDVTGSTSGKTVTGHVTPNFPVWPESKGCVTQVDYFWWTCYQSTHESGFPWYDNSQRQGWTWGDGPTFSDTEQPGLTAPISIRDPYNIAMDVRAIVHVCKGGWMHAIALTGNHELSWKWNKKTKSWTGPAYDAK